MKHANQQKLGGFTAQQVIGDKRILDCYLSQPRGVLILLREKFAQFEGTAALKHIQLVDSAIQTLTFLIGDNFQVKAKQCKKKHRV